MHEMLVVCRVSWAWVRTRTAKMVDVCPFFGMDVSNGCKLNHLAVVLWGHLCVFVQSLVHLYIHRECVFPCLASSPVHLTQLTVPGDSVSVSGLRSQPNSKFESHPQAILSGFSSTRLVLPLSYLISPSSAPHKLHTSVAQI